MRHTNTIIKENTFYIMNKNKSDSIILFRISWWRQMESLDMETRIIMMSSIVEYVETGNVPQLQGEAGLLFDEICRTIDSDRAKYRNRRSKNN